jgi:DNA cross-link repair 1C protein
MDIAENLKADIKSFLASAMKNQRNIALDLDIARFGEQEEMKISKAIKAVAKKMELGKGAVQAMEEPLANTASLPKNIRFPYSRHASLSEQRQLVEAFRPRDVWPCTVSPREWLEDGINSSRDVEQC